MIGSIISAILCFLLGAVVATVVILDILDDEDD